MSGINKDDIKTAQEKFGTLIENESARIDRMKAYCRQSHCRNPHWHLPLYKYDVPLQLLPVPDVLP